MNMMSVNSKTKVAMDSLPQTFTDKFKCNKCKSYFRTPIWIVCHNGHNVCDACKGTYWVFNGARAPCSGGSKCNKMSPAVRNIALEDVYKVSNDF